MSKSIISLKNIQATSNLSRDVDQIDRSFDSDVILTQVRRPNTLPPEVIAIMDEPANMTQRTITQQNAEIVSNLAGTSISKEVGFNPPTTLVLFQPFELV